jgi:eukaryotic-like serine/threonine-protein kinase
LSGSSTPELWERAGALFAELVDLRPEERVERLEGVARTHPEIYADVTSLLGAHDDADELLGGFDELISQLDFEPLSDPVPRLNAALVGRYFVEGKLGEGGMATVYLAADLKHERRVALKVLRPELAAAVGAERFLAEIKTTANLQHPHILPLFDSGEADSFLFYVMPYVEGETLRARLDREKQLPVEEAVRLAQDVADALQAAHEQGVVHRDIKPANILLSRGRPLLADFGIALAVSAAGGTRLTGTGLSLGTPHYMSPEQATGDQMPGPASDIYALGCVLYEMLVGEPPYTGGTTQAILGKIVRGQPVSATDARTSVPSHVDAAIRKTLEKVPADRFTDAQDLVSALSDPGFVHNTQMVEPLVTHSGPWNRLSVGLAALLVLSVAGWAGAWLRQLPVAAPTFATRLPIEIGALELRPFEEIIVSADGSRFAVTAEAEGQRGLYWRTAADENFRLVPGTIGATGATFSPDGEWIAYSDQIGTVQKIRLAGGVPMPVVPRDMNAGQPYWGDDGTIVFTSGLDTYRVPDTGGEPELLRKGGVGLLHPSLLPGGRAVLGAKRGGGIMLLELDTDSVRQLLPDGLDPLYSETGHILYVDQSGGLWAVAFDAASGEVLGGPVPLFDGLSVQGDDARYSVSRNGTLVYGAGGRRGDERPRQRLVVMDLEGNEQPTHLGPRAFYEARWSPDGESVVYRGTESGEDTRDNLYVYSVSLRTAPRRLTFVGIDRAPIWSPEGTRIAFASQRGGTDRLDLFVKSVLDESPAEMILQLPGNQRPTQWLPNDLVLFTHSGEGVFDLWTVDLSGGGAAARPYLVSEANFGEITVSSDGDMAAYTSDESGTPQIYVNSFPEPRRAEVVSMGGGVAPAWSPDGSTIFYWTPGRPNESRSLMAASIERGPPFAVISRDTLLFGVSAGSSWDLHPEGDRFVRTAFVQPVASELAAAVLSRERFLVVVNWFEELRARMGSD